MGTHSNPQDYPQCAGLGTAYPLLEAATPQLHPPPARSIHSRRFSISSWGGSRPQIAGDLCTGGVDTRLLEHVEVRCWINVDMRINYAIHASSRFFFLLLFHAVYLFHGKAQSIPTPPIRLTCHREQFCAITFACVAFSQVGDIRNSLRVQNCSCSALGTQKTGALREEHRLKMKQRRRK